MTACVTCGECAGSISVVDISPPQVFISYQWGHGGVTQTLARQAKRFIETRTELLCWLDVEGGILCGEDHIMKMKLGVERCDIFVAFMSDKYIKSENCRREFAQACEANKFIIPVLVPILFDERRDSEELRESESGWKGETATDDWWKRISAMEGTREVEVRWSNLASFQRRVELRVEKPEEGGEVRADESCLDLLLSILQSRIYRGNFVNHVVACCLISRRS